MARFGITTLSSEDRGRTRPTHLGGTAGNEGVALVSGAPAWLENVTINSGGVDANQLWIYGNSVSGSDLVAVLDTVVSGGTFHYKVNTLSGLYIELSGGTAADITISSTKQ